MGRTALGLLTLLLTMSGCLEPAAPAAAVATAATAQAATSPAPPSRTLFLNAEPACIDPGQFLPAALRAMTPDEPVTVTLNTLPGFLRKRFGLPAVLDPSELGKVGADLEQPAVFPVGLPLYLALEHCLAAEDLDWLWNDGVLVITSSDRARGELVSQQYHVAKLLRRIPADNLFDAILNCTGSEDDGPWVELHGVGGTLTFTGQVLSVRQSQRMQREVACFLQGLEQPQPFLFIHRPVEDLRLIATLRDVQLPVQFYETELRAALDYFGQTAGVPTRLDPARIAEFGVEEATPLTMELPSRPLGQNLDLLLREHKLTAMPLDGVLTVTTAEYANSRLEIALFDVSDIVPDLVSRDELVGMLWEQTGDEQNGPWLDIHGSGGAIATPTDRLLIVRQTQRVLESVYKLLHDLRTEFARRPLPAYADPQAFETRYYRLPRGTAQDLLRLLPHRIAAGTWNTPVQTAGDRAKGTAEIVEVGRFWRQYFPAGFYGDSGTPNTPGPARDPYRDFDAVLVVRQRVAVQKRITFWLNQLLFGDQSGHDAPPTVPSGRLPE